MKVRLEKDIELSTAILYLKIKRKKINEDIRKYLNGEVKYEQIIDKRIKNYLKEIGIYDEKYSLTERGNKTKQDGIIDFLEEGLYKIWFTNNDPYFNTTIFYLKRIEPIMDNNNNNNKLDLYFNNENFCLKSSENNDFFTFQVINNDFFGKNLNDKISIKCIWEWENFDLKTSKMKIQGSIDKIKIDDKIDWKHERDLEDFFSSHINNWDKKYHKYKIIFNEIQDRETKQTFIYKSYNEFIQKLGFKVTLYDLELMPYNSNESIEWRNYLIIEKLKEKYYNQKEIQDICNEINQKEPLAIYNLPYVDIKTFKQKIKIGTKEFWHINAPLDLYPFNSEIYIDKLEINKNNAESISFREIINRLGLINEYDYVFYYDQYALENQNQNKVKYFFKPIKAKQKIIIKPTNKKNYIGDDDFQVIELSELKNGKPPHDRYLILLKDSDLICWNISNSIDYLYFENTNISEDTKGKLRQNVVYTSVSREQIPVEIWKEIEKIKKTTLVKEGKYAN